MHYENVEAFTGDVELGALREVVFLLLTSGAAKRNRTEIHFAALPLDLDLGRWPTGAYPMDYGESGTRIVLGGNSDAAWVLFDGRVRALGTMHPNQESVPIRVYADHLLSFLEDGLEKGCARSRLPTTLAQAEGGDAFGMASLRRDQGALAATLDKALEGLRSHACPTVKR
jgi:hypothetical protein